MKQFNTVPETKPTTQPPAKVKVNNKNKIFFKNVIISIFYIQISEEPENQSQGVLDTPDIIQNIQKPNVVQEKQKESPETEEIREIINNETSKVFRMHVFHKISSSFLDQSNTKSNNYRSLFNLQ